MILLLLIVANGSPLLARELLRGNGHRLDFGCNFIDGRPLLGQTKTFRGILAAMIATPLASEALGLGWLTGLLIGLFAMIGDLFSSFIKRRLGMPSSSRVLGLDEIPESLLPLLACKLVIELPGFQVLLLVVLFFFSVLLLSHVAYRIGIRKKPY